MGTLGRHPGGFAVVFMLLLPCATTSSGGARSTQQPCGVGLSLPSPPASRPHYVLTVHVLRGLRAADGRLAVSFNAPTARGTDRLVFRLWPNGPRYARTGAHLSVSGVREGKHLLRVSYPNPTTLVVARPVAAGQR